MAKSTPKVIESTDSFNKQRYGHKFRIAGDELLVTSVEVPSNSFYSLRGLEARLSAKLGWRQDEGVLM